MSQQPTNARARRLALTLMELLVVVLILSILSTIATGVYTDQTRRARVAATQDLIHQLSIAITRYENDLGAFPPSGTSPTYPPVAPDARNDGSGLLELALVHSMNGNATAPASTLWQGPYISLQAGQLAAFNASATSGTTTVAIGGYNMLDPWGGAIRYVRHEDYGTSTGATFAGGTAMFSTAAPTGANPNLPAPNPYFATEIYYNPSTYQLFSYGPDGTTLAKPYFGTAADDINNFGY
jgi:prepilin-type N-terminal cleavage/methylation domain-containing protein